MIYLEDLLPGIRENGLNTQKAVAFINTSATAFTAGASASNPGLTIDASAANAVVGLKIAQTAAGTSLKVSVTSTATNESLQIDAKGTGGITIAGSSTGGVTIQRLTILNNGQAITAGGAAAAALGASQAVKLCFGSGAPTLSAPQGSIYLRTDGTTTNDRFYVNTNGTTGWTAVTTAS